MCDFVFIDLLLRIHPGSRVLIVIFICGAAFVTISWRCCEHENKAGEDHRGAAVQVVNNLQQLIPNIPFLILLHLPTTNAFSNTEYRQATASSKFFSFIRDVDEKSHNIKTCLNCASTTLLVLKIPILFLVTSQKPLTDSQMHTYTLIPKILYLRRWGKKFSLSFGSSGRVTYG